MYDFKSILATKAPKEQRGIKEIQPEDIGLHYSSVTDYLDAVVGYDKGMMSAIDRLIERYHLGATNEIVGEHRGSVLPRIDKNGRIAGGSVTHFDVSNGTVLKNSKLTDHLYQWYCYDYYKDDDVFFGEHTLRFMPVAVVREEKTALLGALADYPLHWLAVGYGRQLTRKMIDKLHGRQVILFPDESVDQEWELLFGTDVKVDKSFVKTDINRHLINRINKKGGCNA